MTYSQIKAINDAMSLLYMAPEELIFHSFTSREYTDLEHALKSRIEEMRKLQIPKDIVDHFNDLCNSILDRAFEGPDYRD
jgi:hypothetical protein